MFISIASRLFHAAVLILFVLVLNFLLLQLAPGDPIDFIVGEMGGATPEMIEEIRRDYGLDRPIYEQLMIYLARAAQGNLGVSFYFQSPVVDLIFERLGATVLLLFTAIVMALFVGTFVGVIAARKPNSIFSNFLTIFALIGFSAPAFWSGMMLIVLFASVIPIFPIANMRDITISGGWFVQTLDVLYHLALPAFTLAIIFMAQYSRLARASMMEVLEADYIRTARAKGVAENVVVFKHALRNAILPILTVTGLHFAHLLSGAVLVETVFNWPGLGTLAFDSILRRDYTTILGLLFFSAVMVIVANLLTDVCYRIADPRIRAGHKK
jgi:peptide/nickel transport system permease protein